MSNAMFIGALVFICLEILGIIGYIIFTGQWFKSKFANKIENAMCHVACGDGYMPVKGQLVQIEGDIYQYRYRIYNNIHIVELDSCYPCEYEKQRRIIYCQIGSSIPISLPGREPIKYLESENARRMAVESVKAAFNAVVKPGFQITANMIIIGIIVLAVIGGGAWYFISGPGHKTAVINQPTIQTTQVIR
jgi:hypothetical protein